MSVWKNFQQLYPHADLSKFKHTDWDDAVYFKSKHDGLFQVFYSRGSNNYYYTDEIKKALERPAIHHIATHVAAIQHLSNFPEELLLNPKPKLPVPALGHADKHRTFDFSNLDIFVTPKDYFRLKFRNIFNDTQLTHHSGKESHRWMNSPYICYWPQQLNFAVWCVTTGCGISSKMLFDDGELPVQVKSFLWFHVYFTIRRILHELGGIQSSVALPGDSAFDQKKNPCDIPSYSRVCNEFGISPSTDFRFQQGMNEGLGNVYIYFSDKGYVKTQASYPGTFKFSDEGGTAADRNLIQYITNALSEN